jgi:hypothetical protein
VKLSAEQITKAALEMHRVSGASGYAAADLWLASRGWAVKDKLAVKAEYHKRLRSTGEVSA